MLAFAFAADPLRSARVDEAFAETAAALAARGHVVWSYDMAARKLVTRGVSARYATVVYRGWMMDTAEYAAFTDCVRAVGAAPFHTLDAYLATHHAPVGSRCSDP